MAVYIVDHFWTIWGVLAMVCLALELSSGDFYITCLGVGALCALVASLMEVPFWTQVVVFAVFSVLSIFFLRPRLVAWMNSNGDPRVSNADAIIGRTGVVSERVKAGDYGRVKLDGDDWKAETDGAEDIPVGTRVRIVSRDSIIIKVEPLN